MGLAPGCGNRTSRLFIPSLALSLHKTWSPPPKRLSTMGMFDEYEPQPPVCCPFCGKQTDSWQGKDGPRLLLIWRQGQVTPGGHRCSEHLAPQDPSNYRLPREFSFQANAGCRFCPLYGIGYTEDGIWTRTTLVMPGESPFHEQLDLNDGHSFSPHSWTRT